MSYALFSNSFQASFYGLQKLITFIAAFFPEEKNYFLMFYSNFIPKLTFISNILESHETNAILFC